LQQHFAGMSGLEKEERSVLFGEFEISVRNSLHLIEPSSNVEVNLNQRMQVGLRLSQFLEKPEGDFWEAVREIEEDPLFLKIVSLFMGKKKALRIIPRKTYGFIREGEVYSSAGLDVESLLQGKEDIVSKIRLLGREKFVACFLGEGSFTIPEIAEMTGLSIGEVVDFRKKVIDVSVLSDLAAGFKEPAYSVEEPSYEVVAAVRIREGKPEVDFCHERRRYDINYECFSRLLSGNLISDRERKKLEVLGRKMEMINFRLNLTARVVDAVVRAQKSFILSGNEEEIRPLEEKELAGELGIHSSWLCRVLKNRCIATDSGNKPLGSFFITRRALRKRLGRRLIAGILENKDCSDRELAAILFEKHGIKVARRTVNSWRLGQGG